MGELRVLVTGGASGIGLAIAEAFRAQAASVHICDLNREALAEATARSSGMSGTQCDISDPAQVAHLFEEVTSELGGLDVLVNNAGIAGATAPIAEVDLADWKAVLDVNLTGTLSVTQHAIPLLKLSSRGTVIVLSSIGGLFGYPNRVAYSTTKWGLVGFTKTLALELGAFGITANTIHPGAVDGPRMRGVMEQRSELTGRSAAEETELALANQAIRRFTRSEDLAELAVFLAGPAASGISGQTLVVDGFSRAAQ